MRKRSNKPIVERMPCIRLKDIRELIPRHNPHISVNPDAFSWRYPGKVLLSANGIKITDHGTPQFFKFTYVRIGLGKQKLLLVCSCHRKAQVLYYYQGRYACKHCHHAHYLIQHLSHGRRRLWKASRLRLKLGGSPNDDALPKRPKRQSRKCYIKVVDEITTLEQKKYRLRNKEIDIKAFAYHIAR
jgi:hypothetical protein